MSRRRGKYGRHRDGTGTRTRKGKLQIKPPGPRRDYGVRGAKGRPSAEAAHDPTPPFPPWVGTRTPGPGRERSARRRGGRVADSPRRRAPLSGEQPRLLHLSGPGAEAA